MQPPKQHVGIARVQEFVQDARFEPNEDLRLQMVQVIEELHNQLEEKIN